jgi:hypothetical protein
MELAPESCLFMVTISKSKKIMVGIDDQVIELTGKHYA